MPLVTYQALPPTIFLLVFKAGGEDISWMQGCVSYSVVWDSDLKPVMSNMSSFSILSAFLFSVFVHTRLAYSVYCFKLRRTANHGKVVQKHLSKLMTHQTVQ